MTRFLWKIADSALIEIMGERRRLGTHYSELAKREWMCTDGVRRRVNAKALCLRVRRYEISESQRAWEMRYMFGEIPERGVAQ